MFWVGFLMGVVMTGIVFPALCLLWIGVRYLNRIQRDDSQWDLADLPW